MKKAKAGYGFHRNSGDEHFPLHRMRLLLAENAVCKDMHGFGIDTLYLVTDHTSFYERYGWKFLCMVQGDGEPEMTRMYVHKMPITRRTTVPWNA